ncbi:MAG: sortase [Microgenomates group bacterium]|nr:sortase [Microgenomates group bacterium]
MAYSKKRKTIKTLLPTKKKVTHKKTILITSKTNRFRFYLFFFGILFIFFGLIIFFFTYYPVIKEEINYQITTSRKKITEIQPVDDNFAIVIPKIGANAKVIAQVDPFNEKIYQQQLTKGVAHAKGTAMPDQIGNTFLFAHSSVDWYLANRYNSVFYLLNKLDRGDDIYLYYQKQKFHFKVSEKKIVDPSEIKYLEGNKKIKTLTLMTCWPPGTNLKRLLIIAKLTK